MKKIHLFHKLAACNDNQGFTLIEVMMAMVIFVIGILSVAAMQTSATRGNISANKTTRGFTWCSDRMETLMSLPYVEPLAGNLALGPHNPAQNADGIDNDHDGQIDEAGETGNITLTWTVANNAAVPNSIIISVTANWQSPMGDPKTLTLSSVRARNATAN